MSGGLLLLGQPCLVLVLRAFGHLSKDLGNSYISRKSTVLHHPLIITANQMKSLIAGDFYNSHFQFPFLANGSSLSRCVYVPVST